MPWYQNIKKRPFICAISFLLIISILVGLYSCSVTGHKIIPFQKVNIHVLDAITDKAVKEAKVTIGSTTKKTDAGGCVEFELSAFTYGYTISANGYQKMSDKIEVGKSNIFQSINLVPDAIKKAGTYGSTSGAKKIIKGNVNIAADGITLQNMNIKGNLTVDSAVGDGTVTLNHLNVDGMATVNGGGSHSVHVRDCNFTSVIIDKSGVHVVMDGGMTAKVIDIKSKSSLDVSGVSSSKLPVVISSSGEVMLTGSFDTVEITDPNAVLHLAGGTVKNLEVAKGADNAHISLETGASVTNTYVQDTGNVQLSGSFENVQLSEARTSLSLTGGSIHNLVVAKGTSGVKIGLETGTNVANLVLGSAAAVTGSGHIGAASIFSNGSSIAQQPVSAALSSGITATINGVKVSHSIGTNGNQNRTSGKQSGTKGRSAGNGGTIDLSGLLKSQLASMSISGSPKLTYNGSDLTYDLSQLSLSLKNRSGNTMDITWFPIIWTVLSGPASVSGYLLTVSSSGSVTVQAKVYGVASNELTLNVDKGSPVLWKLVASGSPSLTYNGSSFAYDLNHLTLAGQDQFGNAYSLIGKDVTWGVVSGPARIHENTMTVTGSGAIVVQASVDGRGSNQLTIPITLGIPVLTKLKIFGNPSLTYRGSAFTFDLNDLTLAGTDQFENPYTIDKKQVEWMLISGPATISGSTLTITGNGVIVVATKIYGVVSENMTLTVAGAVPALASVILSGSPNLNYNGKNFNYDLSGLTLSGKDQLGKLYDLTGKEVVWSVVSGPATVSGGMLTITGNGTVIVSAKVGSITSNSLALTVRKTDSVLTSVSLSGSPSLTYEGKDLTYDLSSLTLSGKDQFGAAYDLSGKAVVWNVISGPAKVSGSTLTITGSGEVDISADVSGISSNQFAIKVGGSSTGEPVLSQLTVSGSPSLTYEGKDLTYDLSSLTLSGKDQFGAAYDLSGKAVEWNVISGPAKVSGSTLTITGSGEVDISADVSGISSNQFAIKVGGSSTGETMLSQLTVSGSLSLTYEGKDLTYDLSSLTLSGKDQFGAAYDLSGKAVEWNVISGPAKVSGSTLTISGSGEVDISAEVSGISSNQFAIKVGGSSTGEPVLSQLTISGSPSLTYEGKDLTYDLSGLTITGYDQSGKECSIKDKMVYWGVFSGPATVSDNILTITDSGEVDIFAVADGIGSNILALKVNVKPTLAAIAISGNPTLIYDNTAINYDLKGLTLKGTDQFGNTYDMTNENVTWSIVQSSGCSMISITGNTLFIGGGGGTIDIKATADGISSNVITLTVQQVPHAPVLTKLTIPGSPQMQYFGTDLTFDLSGFILSGEDQFGAPYDLTGKTITWSVVSGPATISGSTLTVNSYGSVAIKALCEGVASNDLTFNIEKGPSELHSIMLSYPSHLVYNGSDSSNNEFELKNLLSGLDEFGDPFDFTNTWITWHLISGPASISGGRTLIINGTGTVVIQAVYNQIVSNILSLTVDKAGAEIRTLRIIGKNGAEMADIEYGGVGSTYDLNQLTLSATDQYGEDYRVDKSAVVWNLVSGPATLKGSILTIMGEDSITVTASLNGVSTGECLISLINGLPRITKLTLSGDPVPNQFEGLKPFYYSETDITYNLSQLGYFGLKATDQYGSSIAISSGVSWSVITGPASVSGYDLTINGSGTIVLAATVAGVTSNTIELKVYGEQQKLTALLVSGNSSMPFVAPIYLNLLSFKLSGTDQNGFDYNLAGKQVTWAVSGPASIADGTLSISGPGTVSLTATIDGVTSSAFNITINSGISTFELTADPNLVYNGQNFTTVLSALALSTVDSAGIHSVVNAEDYSWSVVTGPASVCGISLTIKGYGTVVLHASIGGVSVGTLSLTVAKAASVLKALKLSDIGNVLYNGTDFIYDLSNLMLTGTDQFGESYDLTGKQVQWSLVAGTDKLSGSGIAITKSSLHEDAAVSYDTVVATIDGISSGEFQVGIQKASSQLTKLSWASQPTLIYNAANFIYDLNANIVGTDQFGDSFNLSGTSITWTLISGPASLKDSVLTVTGIGKVKVSASVGGLSAGELDITVNKAAPVLTSLSFTSCPTLNYNGSTGYFDLSQLGLVGKDQFGNDFNLSGQQITWLSHDAASGESYLDKNNNQIVILKDGNFYISARIGDLATGVTISETIKIVDSAPVLSCLTLKDYPPQKFRNGQYFAYNLDSIEFTGKDQFGNAYDLNNQTVTWTVISGPATVHGNILTPTGNGFITVQASVGNVVSEEYTFEVNGQLMSIGLSDSPQLRYDGSNVNFDLLKLTLTATDEFGNPCNIPWDQARWYVDDGNAHISGNTLIITGGGTVCVSVLVNGVLSNFLDIPVQTSSPRMNTLYIGGSPRLVYNGKDFTYDLSSLTLSGHDQFGMPYSDSGITWKVLSGPASVDGSILTIMGNGTVIVRASDGSVISNNLNLAVNREGVELSAMTLSGGSSFIYNGSNLSFDMSSLTLTGVDQYKQAYGVNGKITWTVVSGPASVDGSTLTITGDGTVIITAIAENGVTSNTLSFNVSRAASYLASLNIERNTCPIPSYDGQNFNCKMNIVMLTAKDQFGNAFSFDDKSVCYSLVSGPATLSGDTLTINSDGTIVLMATANGVASNKLSIIISRNAPRLLNIGFTTVPSITYNGSPVPFDLTSITLNGTDQYGASFDISKLTTTYRVLSGPAVVSGSTLNVTGDGTVQVVPTVNGINGSVLLINIRAAAPVLTSLTVGGVPSITYDGNNIDYDLNKLIVSGLDQFGRSLSITGLGETFSIISGNASISTGMLTIKGSGIITVSVSVGKISKQFDIKVDNAAQRLAAVSISGSPALTYNGVSFTYDLKSLIVSGSDQFGGSLSLSDQTVAWKVLSGPASIQGGTLTVTGNGTIVLVASVGGITSSGFSLTVSRAAAVLTSLSSSGTPSLSYNGTALSFNLDGLGISGTDQFGGAYNLTGMAKAFSVTSGKASVAGNMLTITDSGTVAVNVMIGGVSTNITFTVQRKAPEIRAIAIGNIPTLTYNGSSFTYDLGKLEITGTDQFGAAIDLSTLPVVWAVSGPASVSNGILTVTNSGSVFVSAAVNGISSSDIEINVNAAEPVLSHLKLYGMPNIKYSGVPVTVDLSQLVIQGYDQFENPIAIGAQTVVWSVFSGPASISGETLTVNGDQPVSVRATIGGVTSDNYSLVINELARPKLLSAQISADGTKIRLCFDQPMFPAQVASYTVSIDGTTVNISSGGLSAGGTEIDLDFMSCMYGKTVTVSCADNVQQALNGAYLAGFDKVAVTDDRNSAQMAVAMYNAHVTAAEAATELNSLFSLAAATVPILLKGAGYNAQETANAMTADYSWTPVQIIGGFISAGFSLNDIATALKKSCNLNEDDAWRALKAGGADIDDMTAAVSSAYGNDTAVIAGCLHLEGASIVIASRQISYLYRTYYSDCSTPEDKFTASTLSDAGYSLNDAVFVLKNIYGDSANGVWSALTSYDAFSSYQMTARYAAFGNVYGFPQLGSELCKLSTRAQDVTGYMKTLGFSASQAGLAIITGFPSINADDFTYSLWNAKYTAAESGSALANFFRITDISKVYSTLIKEYAEDDILDFLKSGLNASPSQIVQIMVSNPGQENIAQKLKTMYGLDAAGCLTALFNGDGQESQVSLVQVVETVYGLKTAGDVMQIIQSLKLTPVQMTQLLYNMSFGGDPFITGGNVWQFYRAAGYTAQNLAQWCKSSKTYQDDTVSSVILNAGYSLTETAQAVRKVYSYDIEKEIYVLWKGHLGSLADIIDAVQTAYGVTDAVPDMLTSIAENSSYSLSSLTGLLKQLGLDPVKGYSYLLNSGYSVSDIMNALRNIYGNSANPVVSSVSLAGGSSLLYNGVNLSFDLGTLRMTACDQYGNPISLSASKLVWSVSSGPAVVSDSHLIITGDGTVVVVLTADGAASNGLSISVQKTNPVLSAVILSGSPNLVYDGSAFTYNLSGITVKGYDQYGSYYDISSDTLIWRVTSGNASINGGVLSFPDGSAAGLTVTAGSVESNILMLTPVNAASRLAALHLGNEPRLTNYGVDYTYDLNGLTLIGSDQFGSGYNIAGISAVWSVVSGDASVSGHTLTVTGPSPITISAMIGNVYGQFVISQNTIARPNLIKAVTSADGMTIRLVFDQEMADPAADSQYFNVLLNGIADPISGITRNPSDPTEIDLNVKNRLSGDSVTVSYREGPVQAWSNSFLASFDAKSVENALEKPSVALSLFKANTSASEAARQLTALFGSDTQEIVSLLKKAGYTADATAKFMKEDCKRTDSQTAAVMISAGYTALETATELQQLYSDTDNVCAQNLLAGGAMPDDIAKALKTAYSNTDSEAAAILLTIGVSAADTGSALKNVYNDTDIAAAKALLSNSTSVDTVAAVMDKVYGDNHNESMKALLQAGVGISNIAAALHNALGASDVAAASAMKGLVTINQIIAALQAAPYQDSNTAITTALQSAGFSIEEITAAWKSTLSDNDTVSLLKNAGYGADDITKVLKNTFSDSAAQAVAVLTANQYQIDNIMTELKNQYDVTNTELYRTLLGAGWSAESIAYVMIQAPFHENIENMPQTLYDAGVSATSALNILSDYFWKYNGDDCFFYLMARVGYSMDDYAQAFKNIFVGDAYDVIYIFRSYTTKRLKPADCIKAVGKAYGTDKAIEADMRFCVNDEGRGEHMVDFTSNMVEMNLGIDDIISDINKYSHLNLSLSDYYFELLGHGHFSSVAIGTALIKSGLFDAVAVGKELLYRLSEPEQLELIHSANISPFQFIQINQSYGYADCDNYEALISIYGMKPLDVFMELYKDGFSAQRIGVILDGEGFSGAFAAKTLRQIGVDGITAMHILSSWWSCDRYQDYKSAGYSAENLLEYVRSLSWKDSSGHSESYDMDSTLYVLWYAGYSVSDVALAAVGSYGLNMADTIQALIDLNRFSPADINSAVSAIFANGGIDGARMQKLIEMKNGGDSAAQALNYVYCDLHTQDPEQIALCLARAGYGELDIANALCAVFPLSMSDALDIADVAEEPGVSMYVSVLLSQKLAGISAADAVSNLHYIYGVTDTNKIASYMLKAGYDPVDVLMAIRHMGAAAIKDAAHIVAQAKGFGSDDAIIVLYLKKLGNLERAQDDLRTEFEITDLVKVVNYLLQAGYSEDNIINNSTHHTPGEIINAIVQAENLSSPDSLYIILAKGEKSKGFDDDLISVTLQSNGVTNSQNAANYMIAAGCDQYNTTKAIQSTYEITMGTAIHEVALATNSTSDDSGNAHYVASLYSSGMTAQKAADTVHEQLTTDVRKAIDYLLEAGYQPFDILNPIITDFGVSVGVALQDIADEKGMTSDDSLIASYLRNKKTAGATAQQIADMLKTDLDVTSPQKAMDFIIGNGCPAGDAIEAIQTSYSIELGKACQYAAASLHIKDAVDFLAGYTAQKRGAGVSAHDAADYIKSELGVTDASLGVKVMLEAGYGDIETAEGISVVYTVGLGDSLTMAAKAEGQSTNDKLIAALLYDKKSAVVSAADAIDYLKNTLQVNNVQKAVACLIAVGYGSIDSAKAAADAYQIKELEAITLVEQIEGLSSLDPLFRQYVEKCKADGVFADSAAADLLTVLGIIDPQTAANYLAEAGYQATDVANALNSKYFVMMSDAVSMAARAQGSSTESETKIGYAKSDLNAGFTAAQTAADLKNNHNISDTKEAMNLMINAGYSQADTAAGVCEGYGIDIASAVQLAAQASGLTDVDSIYIGVVEKEKKSGVNAQGTADFLKNNFGLSDSDKAVVYLVKGGYSPTDAENAMSVYGVTVGDALGMLALSGTVSMDTLITSYVGALKEGGAVAGSAAAALKEISVVTAQQAAAAMLSAGYSETDVAKAVSSSYSITISDAINDVLESEGKSGSDSVNIEYLKENIGTVTDMIRMIQNDLNVTDALTAMKYLFALSLNASDIVKGISSAYHITINSANSMAAQLQGLPNADSLLEAYARNLFENRISIDKAVLELKISCGVMNQKKTAELLIKAGYSTDNMDMANALSSIYQISEADAINAIAGVCTDSTGKQSALLESYSRQLLSGGQSVLNAFNRIVSQGFSQQMAVNSLISAGASVSSVMMGVLQSSSHTGSVDDILSLISKVSGQSIDTIVVSCVYDCQVECENENVDINGTYKRMVNVLKTLGFDDVKTAKYLLKVLGDDESVLTAFGAFRNGSDMLTVDSGIIQAVAQVEGLTSPDTLISAYMRQEWVDNRTASEAAWDLYSKNIITDPAAAAGYLLQNHYDDLQTANALVTVNYGHTVEFLDQAINLVAKAGGKFGLSRKSIYLDYLYELNRKYPNDDVQVFKALYATCQNIGETASYFIDTGEDVRPVSDLINSYLALNGCPQYENDGLTWPNMNAALKDSFNDKMAEISEAIAGNKSAADAAALLKKSDYSLYDVAATLKIMMNQSSDEAKAAMISAGYSDADALAAVRAVYNSDLFQLLHYNSYGLSADHVYSCSDILSQWCRQNTEFDIANFVFDMAQLGCSAEDAFTGILKYRGYLKYSSIDQQDVLNIEKIIFGSDANLLYKEYVYAVSYKFLNESYFEFLTSDLESYIDLLFPNITHVNAMKQIYLSGCAVPSDFEYYMMNTMDEDTAKALGSTDPTDFKFSTDKAYSMLHGYCDGDAVKTADYLYYDSYTISQIAPLMYKNTDYDKYVGIVGWLYSKKVTADDVVNYELKNGNFGCSDVGWATYISTLYDIGHGGYDIDTTCEAMGPYMPLKYWYEAMCYYDFDTYGQNYDYHILIDELFHLSNTGNANIFDLIYSVSCYVNEWYEYKSEVQFVNHLVSAYIDATGLSANVESCVCGIMNYLGYSADTAAEYTATDVNSRDYSLGDEVKAALPVIGGFLNDIPSWSDAVAWLIGGGYDTGTSFSAISNNDVWHFVIQEDVSMLIDSVATGLVKGAAEALDDCEKVLFTTSKIVTAVGKIAAKMAANGAKIGIAGHKGSVHVDDRKL